MARRPRAEDASNGSAGTMASPCQVVQWGPNLVSMSGSVNLGLAFVLEDLPKSEMQPVIVPVVDD